MRKRKIRALYDEALGQYRKGIMDSTRFAENRRIPFTSTDGAMWRAYRLGLRHGWDGKSSDKLPIDVWTLVLAEATHRWATR